MANRPTLISVAEKAGVSKSLASRALRGEPGVSEENRNRIFNIAAELGYSPNTAARSLRGDSRTIAIILNDIGNPHNTDIVAGAEAEARRQGYSVVLGHGSQSVAETHRQIEMMLDFAVCGIIVVSSQASDEALAGAVSVCPTVLISQRRSYIDKIHAIASNDELGGQLAAKHLIEQGCQRLGYLTVSDSEASRARWRGFLHIAQQEQVTAQLLKPLAGVEQIRHDLMGLDGVLANNDLVACQVLRCVKETGTQIPQELKLIGYDNTVIASTVSPTLTSVDQPQRTMGEQAVSTIIKQSEGSTELVRQFYEPTVIARESTSSWPR